MSERCKRNTEELRDILVSLKHDAEYLYQYGDLGYSKDVFHGLSVNDQRILIYLALTEGDKDIQNVAQELMQRFWKKSLSPTELLATIPPEDKAEFMKESCISKSSEETIAQRIDTELHKACERIGHLETEEAFWILIPDAPAAEAVWVEAVGTEGKISSSVRFHNQVIYEPDKEEKYELLSLMRKARHILHVHNHPETPGYITYCKPSDNDRSFALYWKSVRPELASKMRFFIVKGHSFVEY
jgi:hypothetical protein